MPEWNQSGAGPLAEGVAFSPESVEEAQARVYRRMRLRLMLHHIDGAACLLPLVADMDSEQLDAMLFILGQTPRADS